MAFSLPDLVIEETIKGREVLIDADCVAYYGAYGCDELPLRSATRRADIRMKQIIDETRAETYTGYLTGANNFRDLIATLQRYKGNRYDENGKRITKQPEWLAEVRFYLQVHWGCEVVHGQEADDALSIHQKNSEHETIISSIDKDLLINEGLHHDMTSGEIQEVKGFGEVWMKGSECKGTGLKFFCAQLLMGDRADWIKGLPKVTQMMKEAYGIARLGGCGPKAAYLVVSETESYEEAIGRVAKCYIDYWKDNEYTHWFTGKVYPSGVKTAMGQLTEQGQLLWMRQKEGEVWEPSLEF